MGWRQLGNIYKAAADELAAQRATRPTACPNDGQPLKPGPDGYLFCDFDGWSERDAPPC